MNTSVKRSAGVLLPAFSPRREGDLGIGDTRAMSEWMHWAAAHKVGFLQLLPINETGSDDSPYNAISSVALEPLYLTMEDVPGLSAEELDTARANLGNEVIGDRLVHYATVRTMKRTLLEIAYAHFPQAASIAEKQEFENFQREEAAWLQDYTLFRWLMDRARGSEAWDLWPKDFSDPERARSYWQSQRIKQGDAVVRERTFYAWVQWLCFRQWRALRALGDELGVKLMGDIPIGISYYSADVFFQRENFDLEWCGGAPPETMFKHDRFIQQWGQNWGIPVYRWNEMAEQDYPWWKQRIAKLTEIFSMFRIDHILGFYRIYAFPWRPQRNLEFLDLNPEEAAAKTGGRLPQWAWRPDDTEENKRANCADGDHRLRAILEAAGDCEVIGEDLGCVPEYVRPHLESLGIAGFRIPHWDSRDGHVILGEELPECSFATYATHDHDTLTALWEGFRAAAAGEIEPEDIEGGKWNLRMMGEFSGIAEAEVEMPLYSHEVQWHLIEALLQSRSRYAAIMITDLYGMTDRYNMPGTVGGENWRFRLPFSLDDCEKDVTLVAEAVKLRKTILKANR